MRQDSGPCERYSALSHNDEILNSWKEIAAYLNRGVRTVQRWEKELRLPVHRPRSKTKSPVVAFRNELDQWITRTPLRLRESGEATNGDVPRLPAKVLVVEGSVKDLNTCANVLRAIGVPQVDALSNGPVALRRLEELASGTLPRPDLIILHLVFPVDSGCEVLRYWKSTAALKSICVVVWTPSDGTAVSDTEQQLSTMFQWSRPRRATWSES